MSSRWARPSVLVAGSVLLIAALVLGRVSSEAGSELTSAEARQQNGETSRALEHYRRALRWAAPLSSSRTEAIAGLESIARDYEASGDIEGALLAWRSLAGSLAATRFLYSSVHPSREQAEFEIARLLTAHSAAAIDVNLDVEKLTSDHRRLLAGEVSPAPFWATLLIAGFALWLGSLFVATRRGFDAAGQAQWPALRAPIWGALAGFVSFALGLLFA